MTLFMKIKEEREDAKIENIIELMLEMNQSKEDILMKLQQKFSLTEEEAKACYTEFTK